MVNQLTVIMVGYNFNASLRLNSEGVSKQDLLASSWYELEVKNWHIFLEFNRFLKYEKNEDESRWRKSNRQDSIPIHDENDKKKPICEEGNFFNMIKSIYEKSTGSIIFE